MFLTYFMTVGIMHVYCFNTGQIYVGASKSVGIVVLILSYESYLKSLTN